MKLFILALVAISVGLSECADEPDTKEYTNGQALEKYFNIKTKDLKTCKNDENLETNVKVTSTLQALSHANEAKTPTDPKVFQTIITNIVQAALPCADDKEVTTHVTYYNEKGSRKD